MSLPFPGVDAPNKRQRSVEVVDDVEESASIEHPAPAFAHFTLTEKTSGNNYTGTCNHCHKLFKGLKPARAIAHLGGTKGHHIDICAKVPKEVRDQFKPVAAPVRLATQADADSLFRKTTKKDATDNAIEDFFVENAIAFNVAESSSFKAMCSTLKTAGESYKPPSRKQLAGGLLDECVKRTEATVQPVYDSLGSLGGSLLCDG
jgi:hypothetical protein